MEEAFGRAARFIADDLRQMAANSSVSISDINATAARAARAIITDLGNAAHVTEAEYRQMAADIAASLRASVAFGASDFAALEAAAIAAAAKIRESFAAASAASAASLAAAAAQGEAAMDKLASVAATAGNAIKDSLVSGAQGAVSGVESLLKKIVALDVGIGAFGVKGTLALEQVEAALLGVVAANNKLDLSNPGDLAKGKSLVAAEIEQLRTLQKLAPSFSIKSLADASKSIQTFGQSSIKSIQGIGLSSERATEAVKVIAQALVAAGNASDSTLQGAVLPLLQAASTGKLLGQDLNQLAQRLPGIFDRGKFLDKIFAATNQQRKLRGEVALTRAEFEKLRQSEGLEAGAAINAVLDQLRTSKVAKGALERQQKTVLGQFNSLKRTIQNGVLDMFKDVRGPLAGALAELSTPIKDVFSPDGPLLSSIRSFILEGVPLLGKLLPPIVKVIATVNTTLLAAFRAIAPEIGPIGDKISQLADDLGPKLIEAIPKLVDFVKQLVANIAPGVGPAKDIAVAFGIVAAISLDGITRAFGAIGDLLVPIAPALKAIAGLLFDISQTSAGKILAAIAGSLVLIAATTKAVTVLRGVAAALGLIAGAGTAGAAGRVGLLATNLRLLGGVGILVGLDLLYNKISKINEAVTGTESSTFGEDVKGFFGGVEDGLVNAAQGTADGITAALNKIPGVDIDTTEFNKKMDEINDKTKSISDQAHARAAKKIAFQVALVGAEETTRHLGEVSHALHLLDDVRLSPEVKVKVEDALDRIAEIRSNLAAIPNHQTTEYVLAAERAQSDIGKIIADLGNIPGLVQSTVLVDIVRRYRSIMAPSGTPGGSISTTPSGVGIAIDPNQAKQVAAEAEQHIRDATQTGAFSGNGGADKAAKTAADKAKAAAKAFREAIASILHGLDVDFKHGLINDKADQIRKTLADLADSIAKAFDDAGKPRPSKILATIKKDSADLQRLANEREKIIKKLELATARALDAANGVRSFANITSLDFSKSVDAVAKTVTKLNTVTLDVAGSFQVVSRTLEKNAKAADDAVTHTGKDFANALKERLAAIQAFQADIDTLIKRGFRKGVIDQIIAAGPEAGAAAADALAKSSKATKDSINHTQDLINAAATELGNTAAENKFRDKGGQIVDGLIQGLKDRKSDIVKEMTSIATALITAIRKALKIASPSQVLRGIGRFTGKGLALGLSDSLGGVLDATATLAKAAVPVMAPVSLAGLQVASDTQAMAVMRQQLAGQRGTAPVAPQSVTTHHREINAPVTVNAGGLDAAGAERVVRAQLAASLGRAGRR